MKLLRNDVESTPWYLQIRQRTHPFTPSRRPLSLIAPFLHLPNPVRDRLSEILQDRGGKQESPVYPWPLVARV